MVLCVPGSDGCPMTSGLSCCPSCSFGTLNWSPRRRRSRPLCSSWTTIRSSPTRSRPGCGRCAPAGRCPSMRGGDGSWTSSSRTSMTSSGGRNAVPGGGRRHRDRRPARVVRMPRRHRRGHTACPDGRTRRGRRPRTHGVREGEATAPAVAVAGGRVPRVDVVRGELNPIPCQNPCVGLTCCSRLGARPIRLVYLFMVRVCAASAE